jgi:hypothetical protein
MQLTWPKSKSIPPRAAMLSEQRDDPFHLEPLSLQASLHVRDRNSRSRPHKPRKFRFVAEQALERKQRSTELCETRITQSSVSLGETQARTSVQQNSIAGSHLLGDLDDGVRGEMRYPMLILIMLICI